MTALASPPPIVPAELREQNARLQSEVGALQQQLAQTRVELDEKRAEIELLHEIAAAVAGAANLDAMLAFLADVAVRVTSADSSSIYVLDETKGELVLRAVKHLPADFLGKLRVKLGQGLTGWVAVQKQPVVLERDAYLDPRYQVFPELGMDQPQAFLAMPMLAKNEVIGVIILRSRAPHRFTPRSIRLVNAIAGQADAATEGARLQESMRAKQVQLSTISEVSKSITSNLYLEEILQLIVTAAARTMSLKVASVMLLDEKNELVIKATQSKSSDYLKKPPLKVGESIAGRAVQQGKVLTVRDVRASPDYRWRDIAQREGLAGMASVPLRVKDRVIGVLNCYTDRPHTFTQTEIDLLTTLANQAAIAIDNAKLMVRSAIIQEMHHRVKNSLQTVASLLRLQVHHRHDVSAEEALSESISRIQAIAAVHDVLSKEELDQVNCTEVAEMIVGLTAQSMLKPGHQVRTEVKGPEFTLPSHRATSFALVINELVQNAIEHGFGEEQKGHLLVELYADKYQVRLEVSNDGKPLPPGFDPKKGERLGLQIVQTLVGDEMGGRFTMSSKGGYTRAVVTFPR